jgi:ABC-type amino acid transport substrate-binding protein
MVKIKINTTMKKLLTLLILLFSSLVYAQLPTSTVPLSPDIAAIKKKNVLVIAMTKKDVPPFFSGEGENLRGLDVEISRRIGVLLGVPVEFRRDAESFAEVVEQVRDGRADIAVSKLSITGPRLLTVRFSDPYIKLKQAMIINRLWLSQNSQGREVYEVIRTFNGKISFIKNSSYDTFARTNFPKAVYTPEESWDTIINNVTSGAIAAGYRDEFEIKKISFEKPEAAITTKTVTISDSIDNIAVAVNYNAPQLLSIVNHVIRNDYSNIDTKKLMDRYKAEKTLAKK